MMFQAKRRQFYKASRFDQDSNRLIYKLESAIGFDFSVIATLSGKTVGIFCVTGTLPFGNHPIKD